MDIIDATFSGELLFSDKCKDFYDEYGFVVVDILSEEECEAINVDVARLIKTGEYKENTTIYKYSPTPRIVESWKYSSVAKDLALNDRVFALLEFLYNRKPIPFSTINFTSGSNQPLHSDYVHFGSKPEGFLCGVWVALENIVAGVGELLVVPKSHKWDYFRYCDVGLAKPTKPSEIKANYSEYEKWVVEKLKTVDAMPLAMTMKAGQAAIWSANLLHGGGKITLPGKSRKSQVTHYHFEGCDHFYNPNFSFFGGEDDIAIRNIDPIQ